MRTSTKQTKAAATNSRYARFAGRNFLRSRVFSTEAYSDTNAAGARST